MPQEELKKLIDELVRLGEDKDELEFWLEIFPDMEKSEQQELVKNLQNELEQLSKFDCKK